MPSASFSQVSFLGGEWSGYSQGRTDSERYKTAMNVCFNSYPLEEGSWSRRQGTRTAAMTKGGLEAVLRSFSFSVAEPYQVELGEEYARFFLGPFLVFDTPVRDVTNVTSTTPAVVTTSAAHGFANDDQVMFSFEDDQGATSGPPNGEAMRNRQFIVDNVTATTFELYDPVTGAAVDGSTLQWNATPYLGFDVDEGRVSRISEVVTPYEGTSFRNTRKTQNDEFAYFFNPEYAPQRLAVTGLTADPFAWTAQTFIDGPYLDPPDPDTNTTTLDPSGVSGSVTLTASATTNINGGAGFLVTDVGRLIRLFWEPAAWSSASTYAAGDLVKYNDQYFVVIKPDGVGPTGKTPERDVTAWAFATDATVWTWGTVTAHTSTTVVTFLIQGPALPDHTPRLVWRLGLFSDTTGWPKFGSFHDGRLWLGGSVIKNRIDGSVANSLKGPFDFTPTLKDGTVTDANAIDATANSDDKNEACWIITDDEGIFVGTEGGEWRGRASATNDPISPTNFDFKRVSKYKCFDVEPSKAPTRVIFIQLTQRKVMEWGYAGADGFVAAHLSVTGRHLTASGMAEVVYQADPVPMLWFRREDETLIGSAYKRDAEAGYHAAWWEAELAWNASFDPEATNIKRVCTSVSAGVSLGGLSEALWMVTRGPDVYYEQDLHFVEILTPVFEDDQEPWAAWFVDSGNFPQAGQVTINPFDPTDESVAFGFSGLWNLRGQTVSILINGIDFGDYLVDADGSTGIPAAAALARGVTASYILSLDDPLAYGEFGVTLGRSAGGEDVQQIYITIPVVFGLTYESRGQLLRPDFGNDAGAANGPAFAKFRRVHKFAFHMHRGHQLEVGTDFADSLKDWSPKQPDGTVLPIGELFSGVIKGNMDDEYGTEGKIAWRINRPYPCVITAVAGYIQTQDE